MLPLIELRANQSGWREDAIGFCRSIPVYGANVELDIETRVVSWLKKRRVHYSTAAA